MRLEREAKAKEKEKAKDKERGKGKEKGNGKEKGKGKDDVERETVEEMRARIAYLQEQWFRGEIHNLAEYKRRAQLALGVLKATPPSKEAHEFKSCDTGTLRYRADVPLNARWGGGIEQRPSTGLMDGHGHGMEEQRLGLIIVQRVEPQSWLLGRRQGMELQSR